MVPIDYGEIKWKCEDERNESDANKPKCQFQIRLRWHHKCGKKRKRKKIHERYNSITYNFQMSRDIHTVFFYLCLQWHRIHWRPTTFSVIICCLLWENVCMLTFFTSIDIRRFTLNFSWFYILCCIYTNIFLFFIRCNIIFSFVLV